MQSYSILVRVLPIFNFLLFFSCISEDHHFLISGKIEPEVITKGYRFTEGPYWHQDGYLLFSDIPANTIYKWAPGDVVEVFMENTGNSNGIQGDIYGSIIFAQHEGKISKLTTDGKIEIIVDNYEGKRLNSPNDLAVHSNNTIYFTDPPFGVKEVDRELDFSG